MFRQIRTPGKNDSLHLQDSRHWLRGMVAGQLLGFGVAVLVVASVPALVVTIIVGGVVGSLAAQRQAPRPLKDKRIRSHVFEALQQTSQRLNEIIIKEEFESASSGGEKDRRSMKQAPAAKLAVPPPRRLKWAGCR